MKINKVFTKLISRFFGAKEPKPEEKNVPSGSEKEAKHTSRQKVVRYRRASNFLGAAFYEGNTENGDAFNTHQQRKHKSNRLHKSRMCRRKHRRTA